MWRRVVSTKERIVDLLTVNIRVIETEQLVFLFHLIYLETACS